MALSKEQLGVLMKTLSQLEQRKKPFEAIWKRIVENMGLAYGDFADPNKQDVPKYRLYDTTARDASETLADGVEGYAFNRSTKWFGYKIVELKEGADRAQARALVEKVQRVAYKWLDSSNFYDESTSFIRNGADLGTSAMLFIFDRERSIPRFSLLHLKDVFFIASHAGELRTMFRYVWLTKKEAESFFGESVELPREIQECKDELQKFKFVHMEAPVVDWPEFDIKGIGDYFSLYWYFANPEKTFKEERLTEKDNCVWRWKRQIYGGEWGVDSPGMSSLPMIEFVNTLQEDILTSSELAAKGLWKKTKGLKVNFRAGGITELESGQDFAHVTQANDLSWLQAHIDYYRKAINTAYKTDLFLILSQNIDQAKTATEVAGIETEKNNLMSSFFSRLGKEFLEPVLTWLFKQVLLYAGDNDALDVTEEEIEQIEDMELSVEFASPYFTAQEKNFELNPSVRWMNNVIALSQINSAVLDRIDWDAYVELDHDLERASEKLLVSKAKADEIRQLRAQAQQQALASAQQQAQSASDRADYETYSKAPETGSSYGG